MSITPPKSQGPERRRVTPEGATINPPPWGEGEMPTFQQWWDWLITHDTLTMRYLMEKNFEAGQRGHMCYSLQHEEVIRDLNQYNDNWRKAFTRMYYAWLSARRRAKERA